MSSTTFHTCKYTYTPAGVVHNGQIFERVKDLSSSELGAASRAILHHKKCADSTEDATRHLIDGLHPMYISLHSPSVPKGVRAQLLADTFMDLLDVVGEVFCIKIIADEVARFQHSIV